jgi:hypothetical protein
MLRVEAPMACMKRVIVPAAGSASPMVSQPNHHELSGLAGAGYARGRDHHLVEVFGEDVVA